MRHSPGNRVFHRLVDMIPTHLKARRHFVPAHPTRPAGEEPFVFGRQATLAFGPRNTLHFDATRWTVHPTHLIDQYYRYQPQRNKLESPSLGQRVVTTATNAAPGTCRQAILSCTHRELDRWSWQTVLHQLDLVGFLHRLRMPPRLRRG